MDGAIVVSLHCIDQKKIIENSYCWVQEIREELLMVEREKKKKCAEPLFFLWITLNHLQQRCFKKTKWRNVGESSVFREETWKTAPVLYPSRIPPQT